MRLSKKFAAIAITATVALTATAAFAFWTGSGAGDGTAGSATGASGLTVNQTAVSSLAPGGSVALSGTFDNTNSGSVSVTSVTATVTIFSLRADITKPACTQADFSISGTSNNPGVIAPGTGVGSWSGLSLDMSNGLGNQDNCKGISVPVHYVTS